jgi:hypothetical protein
MALASEENEYPGIGTDSWVPNARRLWLLGDFVKRNISGDRG